MLIQNAIKITENYPDEFFLVSAHRHDYQSFTFKNGDTIAVDGGNCYVKRSYTDKKGYVTKWMEWCIDDSEPLYAIKNKLLWGTYGKSGNKPLKYVLLKSCETEHLKMILKQANLSELYQVVINKILKDRKPKKKIKK